MGRPPLPPRNLPHLNETSIQSVCDWLQAHTGAKRPPKVKAALVVLAYELQKLGEAWPTREQLAAHIGSSKDGADEAVNDLEARGLLARNIRRIPGNIARRENIVKETHFELSGALASFVP